MAEIQSGERELGRAVILRAIEDASAPKDSFDRREARLFLCAKNELWARSLRFWCYIAGWEEDDVISYARKRWERNEHYLN